MKQGSHLSCFSSGKSMAHQCAAISGADTNTKAVVEFCSTTAVVSVPNLRSKAPTHHQVFWLMQPGADRKNKIHAPHGFLPSHGLPPTMAAFRRKAAQLQIQLRGKPRIPTGFLLSPPPRSAAAKGRMIRCSSIYIILISYSCTPVNILFRKRGPPPAASAGGGWVRVWARTQLERK